MEHYNFIKVLFDANQEEFTLEEIRYLSNLPTPTITKYLNDLCVQNTLNKKNDFYLITEDGRVDFANAFSKRVMMRLLLFSFFMTFVLYIFAKLIK